MKKTFKFSFKLLLWYRRHARDLPWRNTEDPYRIWLSEIMLQQTTVKAVIPYYEQWLSRYPNIKSVGQAPIQELLKQWQGLGYYQRVRNFHKAAKVICEEYSGVFPKEISAIKSLPGFGPYTTAAVASIAFRKVIPVLDGNVRRVMMRFLCIRKDEGRRAETVILKYLSSKISKRHPGDFNQAMMELGATICRPKGPVCNLCPLRGECQAYKMNFQELIPSPRKVVIETIYSVSVVIVFNGKFYIQKRPSKGVFADLWEFPNQEVLEGSNEKKTIKIMLREYLNNYSFDKCKKIDRITHYYTKYKGIVSVYLYQASRNDFLPKNNLQFVNLSGFDKLPMSSANARIVERLQK